MRRRPTAIAPVALALVALASLACATPSTRPAALRTPGGTLVSASSSRVLGEDRLSRLPATLTLHDAVVGGRAGLMIGRFGGAALYVDGQRFGDWSYMHGIPIAQVREVRLLTPSEAQSRYGPLGGRQGAIDVVTYGTRR